MGNQNDWIRDQWDKNWLSLLGLGVATIMIYAGVRFDLDATKKDVEDLKEDRKVEQEFKVKIEGRLSTIEADVSNVSDDLIEVKNILNDIRAESGELQNNQVISQASTQQKQSVEQSTQSSDDPVTQSPQTPPTPPEPEDPEPESPGTNRGFIGDLISNLVRGFRE